MSVELRMAMLPETVQRLLRISVMWKNVGWDVASDDERMVDDQRNVTIEPAEAEAVSSLTRPAGIAEPAGGYHRPMLDLDFPAAVLPSSTEGHCHLYIDKALTWEQYEKLLDVMAEVGLLEEGYVRASKARKCTFLRLPWIRKGREREDRGLTVAEVEDFLAQPPAVAHRDAWLGASSSAPF